MPQAEKKKRSLSEQLIGYVKEHMSGQLGEGIKARDKAIMDAVNAIDGHEAKKKKARENMRK